MGVSATMNGGERAFTDGHDDEGATMPYESEGQDFGRLFVTSKCCGSATCRNFAPELLGEVATAGDVHAGRRLTVLPGSYEEGAFTGVLRQPRSKEDLIAARTAVASCPFGAIKLQPGASPVRRSELGSPWRGYPRPIEDDVWVIGPPSMKNFGAKSREPSAARRQLPGRSA